MKVEGKLELADVSEFVQPVGPATIIPYTCSACFSLLSQSSMRQTGMCWLTQS